jgi:hypothetical protein
MSTATTQTAAGTVDEHAVRMFRNEQKRHQDAALRALREARDTLTRLLTAWEGNPSTVALSSDARRAANLAVEGASRAEALNALHDVAFIVDEAKESTR